MAALLLVVAAGADNGQITKFLPDSVPVFDLQGVQQGRKTKAELPKSAVIIDTNAKSQLGVRLADGSVVYVRRGDVAYTGTPPGPCIVVAATPRPGRESLAAGSTGATKGAGEEQRACVPR